MQPYCGYYANRTRGERRKAEEAAPEPGVDGGVPTGDPELPEGAVSGVPTGDPELPEGAVTIVTPADFSRGEAKRRWAELIRLECEVEPMVCPKCGGQMRVIALIREPKVTNEILRHLRA